MNYVQLLKIIIFAGLLATFALKIVEQIFRYYGK